MMTPATISSMAMYLNERDYVKSLFDNPGRALTLSVSRMTRTHTTVIVHFNVDTQYKMKTSVSIQKRKPEHIYMYKSKCISQNLLCQDIVLHLFVDIYLNYTYILLVNHPSP